MSACSKGLMTITLRNLPATVMIDGQEIYELELVRQRQGGATAVTG